MADELKTRLKAQDNQTTDSNSSKNLSQNEVERLLNSLESYQVNEPNPKPEVVEQKIDLLWSSIKKLAPNVTRDQLRSPLGIRALRLRLSQQRQPDAPQTRSREQIIFQSPEEQVVDDEESRDVQSAGDEAGVKAKAPLMVDAKPTAEPTSSRVQTAKARETDEAPPPQQGRGFQALLQQTGGAGHQESGADSVAVSPGDEGGEKHDVPSGESGGDAQPRQQPEWASRRPVQPAPRRSRRQQRRTSRSGSRRLGPATRASLDDFQQAQRVRSGEGGLLGRLYNLGQRWRLVRQAPQAVSQLQSMYSGFRGISSAGSAGELGAGGGRLTQVAARSGGMLSRIGGLLGSGGAAGTAAAGTTAAGGGAAAAGGGLLAGLSSAGVVIAVVMIVVVGGLLIRRGMARSAIAEKSWTRVGGIGGTESESGGVPGRFIPLDGVCWPIAGAGVSVTDTPGSHADRGGVSFGGTAIDIGALNGTEVVSPFPGVVSYVNRSNSGYGYQVQIRVDFGSMSDSQLEEYTNDPEELREVGVVRLIFAHLESIASGVEQGTTVRRGDVIGFSDDTGNSTGPHLHYEAIGIHINSLLPVPNPALGMSISELCP